MARHSSNPSQCPSLIPPETTRGLHLREPQLFIFNILAAVTPIVADYPFWLASNDEGVLDAT
jgi:hypothetical protein